MYIEIRLMKNNGEETGLEYGTPNYSDFVAKATYEHLVKVMRHGAEL